MPLQPPPRTPQKARLSWAPHTARARAHDRSQRTCASRSTFSPRCALTTMGTPGSGNFDVLRICTKVIETVGASWSCEWSCARGADREICRRGSVAGDCKRRAALRRTRLNIRKAVETRWLPMQCTQVAKRGSRLRVWGSSENGNDALYPGPFRFGLKGVLSALPYHPWPWKFYYHGPWDRFSIPKYLERI